MSFPYWPGSPQIFQQLAIDGEELSIVPFGNTVTLPTTYSTLTADHISTTVLDANDINTSTIFAYEVFIDNQGLTANGSELLLNGIPIATTSNLSSITDWSFEPAVHDVYMNNYNLLSAMTIESKLTSSLQGLFSSINTGNVYANSIVCEDLTALSSIHSYNYTSSVHLVANDALVSTVNTNTIQSSTIQTQFLNTSTVNTNTFESSTIQTQTIATSSINTNTIFVSSLNGTDINQIISSVTNPASNVSQWAFYPALEHTDFNGKDINNGQNIQFYSLERIGGPLGGDILAGDIQCDNLTVSASGTGLADVAIYGANALPGDNALYVEGGTTLTGGGIVHGVTIGALRVLGVDTQRIDVLPAGINVNAATYVQLAAAGAGSFAAGGALSLAGGDYVEINTGEVQCVNTTSGQSWLSVNNVQGNSHNGGDGTLEIHSVTRFEGTNIQMNNISSINGQPISYYEPGGVSTISTFVDLTTSSLTVSSINGYEFPNVAPVVSSFTDLNVLSNTSTQSLNVDYINGYSGSLINIGGNPIAGSYISFDTTPSAGGLQIDSSPPGNSFMNADNISVDTLQPKNGNDISLIGVQRFYGPSTQFYASNVAIGPSTFLTAQNDFPTLAVRNSTDSNMCQINVASVAIGDPQLTFQGAYSYSAADDRATVVNSSIQTKYVAYLDDLQNLATNSLSTNSISTGTISADILNSGDASTQITLGPGISATSFGNTLFYSPIAGNAFTVNYTSTLVSTDLYVGNTISTSALYASSINDQIGFGDSVEIYSELEAYVKLITPAVSSVTISTAQATVSSLTFTGLPNSTITFATSDTAGSAGQPAGRLMMTGQDMDLGQNNLWAKEIKVGASDGTAATPEIVFYGPDNTTKAFNVGNVDRTIRIQSTIGSSTGGYLLDSLLNPPFFSSINNQVSLMAYFPSTNSGTIGVSTLSKMNPVTQYGRATLVAGSKTVVLPTHYADSNEYSVVVTQNGGAIVAMGATINSVSSFTATGAGVNNFFWQTIGKV